jgi:hypothetical protein
MTADPNPYRPPASDSENADSAAVSRDKLASRAFVVGAIQAVVWIGAGLWVLRTASSFKKIFDDFGTELPGTTLAFIQFTHFVGRFWYLALPVVALWPLANRRIVFLLSPRPDVVIPRRLWYVVTWATLPLALAFAVEALFRPLMELITKLSR